MAESRCNVFLKADQVKMVYRPNVLMGDIVKIHCNHAATKKKINHIVVYQFKEPSSMVFSILKLIELIQREVPNATIQNCGESDLLVEYRMEKKVSPVLEFVKLFFICLIVFFGAAFTIMAFHNDISINDLFVRFYRQLTGQEKPLVSIIEISYSIGLAIGILVFFNHFRRQKNASDPTPIQIEMRKYEKDMGTTIIENASRRNHVKDVD